MNDKTDTIESFAWSDSELDESFELFNQIEAIPPAAIEKRSMEIIAHELDERGIILVKENEAVIKRVIHATADFDYAEHLVFSDGAVPYAVSLLKNSKPVIITDTNMALAGISKIACKKLGIDSFCFMADEDVARHAEKTGATRASCSIDKAVRIASNNDTSKDGGISFSGRPLIFAAGNAPTALVRLRRLFDAGYVKPALIIGVPVGFVNVAAAKELIIGMNVPYIVARGRKGGSTVAAAIVNALLYKADGER